MAVLCKPGGVSIYNVLNNNSKVLVSHQSTNDEYKKVFREENEKH